MLRASSLQEGVFKKTEKNKTEFSWVSLMKFGKRLGCANHHHV